MADSKPSPKSSLRAWRSGATTSSCIAGSAMPARSTAASTSGTCPPSATSTSTPSRTRSFPPCICWRIAWTRRSTATRRMQSSPGPPRAVGVPIALNVDGLERNRKKWNRLARAWYEVSEYLATICPNVIVSDAQHISALLSRAIPARLSLHPLRRFTRENVQCGDARGNSASNRAGTSFT